MRAPHVTDYVEAEVIDTLSTIGGAGEAFRGELADVVPHNVHEAFAQFLEIDVANGDATDDTIDAYYREVAKFCEWCAVEGIDPARARRGDIEGYREHLKRRGLVVASRAQKMSIIRRFYEAAVKYRLIPDNPAQRVKGGKDLTPPEEKIKTLSKAALEKLLAGVDRSTLAGKRDSAAIALMAVHGLRRVEVHRIDHEHIDTELTPEGDAGYIVVHGKGNRIRKVYLRPDTYRVLLRYIKAKQVDGLPLTGAVFVAHGNRSRGLRMSRRYLNVIVDRYLDEAELKRAGVSCHALRHTHGTLAVAGGASVEHLREEMGHSNIETTGIYVRAVNRVKHNPANYIDVEVD